jgi:Mrp family chromosome partitioning ATPase
MISAWLHSIEQIMLAAVNSKTRVIGVLSPDRGSGVSTLCAMLAESFARSGMRTLLVDLASPMRLATEEAGWVPGEPALQHVRSDPKGYDVLAAPATPATRALFNKADAFRGLFDNDLKTYAAIVVDLPPPVDRSEDMINPMAAASACDTVIMVCAMGQLMQPRIKATVADLTSAGVVLGGTVINHKQSPTLGVDMAAAVRRLTFVLPRTAPWLARKLAASKFLNSRI